MPSIKPEVKGSEVRSKLFFLLAIGILSITVVMLIVFFYVIFFPQKILEMKRQPLITTDEVVAGNDIIVDVDYCKHVTIVSDLEVAFNGSVVVPALMGRYRLPTGCHRGQIPIMIPASLPAGTWNITLKFTYHLNGVRNETYEFETEPFIVKENEAVQRLLGK